MTKNRSFISQALLSLGLALVLIAGDFFFFWHQFEDRYPRPWSALYEIFGLMLLLSVAFKKRGFLIACSALSVAAFLQMAHLSFFGTFLHATKIYLFFTNLGEVAETTSAVGSLLILPGLILGLSIFAYWLFIRLKKTENWTWAPLKWILAGLLIYYPARNYIKNTDIGKNPAIHNMAFSNFYWSFAYFLGRTLPFKMSHRRVEAYQAQFQRREINPKANIIFILGESLRYQNMQLFGYSKPTTPELMKLKDELPSVIRKGIAGGVATDVAIPLFINNFQSVDPMAAILSQQRCLFKLAKENGFQTHFYSAQAEGDLKHIVNYLCLPHIDQLKIGPGKSLMEDIDKRYYDDILLTDLERVDFSKPNFVLLHQRGSHSPYNLRYPPGKGIFPVDESADLGEQMITHYDNSVGFTDEVVAE
ncbi:MAG: sulfatase-like hydrolase/transferase, partial [Pseudobdellovibrionaceae bacterium]